MRRRCWVVDLSLLCKLGLINIPRLLCPFMQEFRVMHHRTHRWLDQFFLHAHLVQLALFLPWCALQSLWCVLQSFLLLPGQLPSQALLKQRNHKQQFMLARYRPLQKMILCFLFCRWVNLTFQQFLQLLFEGWNLILCVAHLFVLQSSKFNWPFCCNVCKALRAC